MSNVAIVTDSTCDMPPDWPGWKRVVVAPIHIHFGDDSYREGVDIDEETFYARVDAEGVIPKTSQPSPGELAELYRSLGSNFDSVISMHIGGKLSGTYQSASLAAQMVADEITVYPFDSDCGSAGLGFMALETIERLDQGQSVESILERLQQIRESMNIFLTPDTVKYVQMSGRINALGAALASLLNIKPIIVLKEGELFADERVRTRKKALARMVDMMQERLGDAPARVAVGHACAPQAANQLAALAADRLNCDHIWFTPLATSIAVHLGPGTAGLIAYPM